MATTRLRQGFGQGHLPPPTPPPLTGSAAAVLLASGWARSPQPPHPRLPHPRPGRRKRLRPRRGRAMADLIAVSEGCSTAQSHLRRYRPVRTARGLRRPGALNPQGVARPQSATAPSSAAKPRSAKSTPPRSTPRAPASPTTTLRRRRRSHPRPHRQAVAIQSKNNAPSSPSAPPAAWASRRLVERAERGGTVVAVSTSLYAYVNPACQALALALGSVHPIDTVSTTRAKKWHGVPKAVPVRKRLSRRWRIQ